MTEELEPVQFTRLQVVWLLRRLRADRNEIADNLLLIEERVRAGYNGHLAEAFRALEADRTIADSIIVALWALVGSRYVDKGRMPAGPPPAKKK